MNRRLICLLCLLPALAFGQKNKAAPPPPTEPVAEDKTVRDPNKLAALSLLGDSVQLISLNPARGDTVRVRLLDDHGALLSENEYLDDVFAH